MANQGRPELYSEELGKRICELVAASKYGLRKTLEDHEDLPSMRTVLRWQQNNAHFSQMYAQAKRQQLESMAEDIVDISMDDTLDPNDKRIRIDTRKWLLSKLMHKTYGDKLDVTSDGQALSTPTHLIDARVQSIIMGARARRLGQQQDIEAELTPEALKLLG